MDNDAVASIDEAEGIVAGYGMATRGEDKLADIIVGDHDWFFAIEILADDEIAAVVFFLFLLIGFLLTIERHIAQPALRFLVVVL